MKAVQWRHGQIQVADVPEPSGDGELVSIHAAGICGTDVHLATSGFKVIPGHELAGRLPDGTPVAIEPIVPCERCDQCCAGNYHRCREGVSIFVGGMGGVARLAMIHTQGIAKSPLTAEDIADNLDAILDVTDARVTASTGIEQ